MNTQYTTQEILQSSIQNINTLKDHLEKIDELRIDIKNTVEEAEKLPEEFNNLIVRIDRSTDKFIQKNQELLKEQIVYFQEKLIDLTIRINQIDELDFSKKFEISKDEFFSGLDSNIVNLSNVTKSIESDFTNSKNNFFDAIETSSVKLNETIEEIKSDFTESKILFFEELDKSKLELDQKIKELKAVDLEAHFNKHDKTLSDIFISINNISSSLISFSNQLNAFLNKINEIDNHILVLDNRLLAIEKKLESIESIIEQNTIKLNNTIDVLTKKNQTSHLINLILIVVTIITIIVLKYI